MGRAILHKSLIQFSVDEWGCIHSLLFTWGQTIVEVMKIMVIIFKYKGDYPSSGPMHALLHSVPPTLKQATTDPYLPWRLLGIHRQVWVSLLWVLVYTMLCLCPPRVCFSSPL